MITIIKALENSTEITMLLYVFIPAIKTIVAANVILRFRSSTLGSQITPVSPSVAHTFTAVKKNSQQK
ncbi:MAG: hypothetical protein HFH91_10800 [Lachnospiraceae bacterium]|nr:hypothetical protein [Lachnospiraceae bacterium]